MIPYQITFLDLRKISMTALGRSRSFSCLGDQESMKGCFRPEAVIRFFSIIKHNSQINAIDKV